MEQKISAVLVDDEKGNRENLLALLKKYCPEMEVLAEADSAETGYAAITANKPDLVFLDIEMPLGDGFQMLEHLGQVDFEVVFVTAFDQYALQAIKCCALDYLLKPVNILELKSAVEKVKLRLQEKGQNVRLQALQENLKNNETGTSLLALPTAEQVQFVKLEEVVRCKGDNNYTQVHLTNGQTVLVSRTLKEYDDLLTDKGFVRVHQSHLVNRQHVLKFVKSDGGYLVLKNGDTITVSRQRKEAVLNRLSGL